VAKNRGVYAAGCNQFGQLGLGDTKRQKTFVEVTFLRNKDITEIVAGNNHTIATLKNKKALYITGNSEHGQLGDYFKINTFTKISVEGIEKIAAGGFHTLNIAKDGNIYGTGENEDGQLGLGDIKYQRNYVEITSLRDKGITEIAAGGFCTFVIARNGKTYAAGNNGYGQLGIGNIKTQKEFIEVPSLKNKSIIKIVVGVSHAFAITNGWRIYAAGNNEKGQLGLGDIKHQKTFTEVLSLRYKRVIEINVGYEHTFVLTTNGEVYVAGGNSFGELGLGDYIYNQKNFVEVLSLKNKNIIKMVVGDSHAFALAKNGDIYVAGDNVDGQLGLGDKVGVNVFTLLPGIKFIFEDAKQREFTKKMLNNTEHLDIAIKRH
jgi:alpha-tubulin suppressor-like RCC1 family protein